MAAEQVAVLVFAQVEIAFLTAQFRLIPIVMMDSDSACDVYIMKTDKEKYAAEKQYREERWPS
jgi:hypothetical protein